MKKMLLVGVIAVAAALAGCDKKEEKKVPVPTPTPVPMSLQWVLHAEGAITPCGPGPKGMCSVEGEEKVGHPGEQGSSFNCKIYKCKLMPVK